MRPEGPGEALLGTTTPIHAEREDLVSDAIRGMSPVQRTRLEQYARQAGTTVEALVVQIVEQVLKAEGR